MSTAARSQRGDSRGTGLNLARHPFRNQRPIVRLAIVLWLAGGLLLALNGMQYWRYFTGSEERRAELESLQQRIADHRRDISDLEARFRALGLRQQNAEVRFLNRKIAERAFSWSGLFDRLADVLPNDVRLISLSPQARDSGRSRGRESEAITNGEIELNIIGVARSPEAQLAFIEALFTHPAFRDPELSRDSLADGQVRFELTTVYLPDPVDAGPDATAAETVAEAVAEGSTPSAPTPDRGATASNLAAAESPPAESLPASGTPPAPPAPSLAPPSLGGRPASGPTTATPSAPGRSTGPVLQGLTPTVRPGATAPGRPANPDAIPADRRPVPRQPDASSSPAIR